MATPTLLAMPVGGNQQMRPHGGPTTSAPSNSIQIMEITQLGLSGLSPPSASSGGRGGEEIWASGCMAPSMSSPSPLSGTGSEKAGLTHQHQRGLALCICVVM